MYVEMQMMKAEMEKLVKKGNSSGDANPLDHQNSSFGDHNNHVQSFQRRPNTNQEETKQGHPMQHYRPTASARFVFARGAQGDQNNNGNVQHFGGTRYNQVGAQSMSVASVSLANNRQSV